MRHTEFNRANQYLEYSEIWNSKVNVFMDTYKYKMIINKYINTFSWSGDNQNRGEKLDHRYKIVTPPYLPLLQ